MHPIKIANYNDTRLDIVPFSKIELFRFLHLLITTSSFGNNVSLLYIDLVFERLSQTA